MYVDISEKLANLLTTTEFVIRMWRAVSNYETKNVDSYTILNFSTLKPNICFTTPYSISRIDASLIRIQLLFRSTVGMNVQIKLNV